MVSLLSAPTMVPSLPLWTLSLWTEVKINLFFPELFLVIVFYHGNRKTDNKVGVYTHTHMSMKPTCTTSVFQKVIK